jgi:hypothetical protein
MAMTKRTTWKPNAQWKLSAMEQGASLDGKQVKCLTNDEGHVWMQVSKRLKAIKRPTGAVLAKGVVAMFKNAPDKEWRAHLDAVVNKKA